MSLSVDLNTSTWRGIVLVSFLFSATFTKSFAFSTTDATTSSYPYDNSSTTTEACNGGVHISGTHGVITSPNYPNNYPNYADCSWEISVPDGMVIAVKPHGLFFIEEVYSCDFDALTFDNSKVFCGYDVFDSFWTTNNSLSVTFTSDYSVTDSGFSFSWTAVDNSSIPERHVIYLSSDSGTISSSNYPSSYDHFVDDVWIIETSDSKQTILIEFEPLFDLEESVGEACPYDSLTISAGSYSPSIHDDKVKLCGSAQPSNQHFMSSAIYVSFKTDNSINGAGFSLKFTKIDASCDGYNYINGTSGTLSTPLFPQRYLENEDCIWFLTAPENKHIAIRFDERFYIGSYYYYSECYNDYLQIFDGPSTDAEQYLHDFCGSHPPRGFLSTTNAITVRFVSSSYVSYNAIGFSFNWTTEEKCLSDEIRCWDGTCIQDSFKCNGIVECPFDAADEASCATSNGAQCGKQEIAPEFQWDARIVGGYKAKQGSWPWQGHMHIFDRYYWNFQCGVVLISEEWAMTAAHCIDRKSEILLTFGDHDISDNDIAREQEVSVNTIVIHPHYDDGNYGYLYGYDIAMLHLSPAVNITTWVKPICLPQSSPEPGTLLVITGWGVSNVVERTTPNIMHQVRAPVTTLETCSKLYNRDLPDNIICAGLDHGAAGACWGDSGGPAVYLRNGTWEVAGLSSFTVECGTTGTPTGYADVFKLLPFIADVMSNSMNTVGPSSYVIRNQTSGNISSPNYERGHNYPNGEDIKWQVVVPEGQVIAVRFASDFFIERSYGEVLCEYDYLIVHDGADTSASKYGNKRFCGNLPPPDFETTSNSLTVQFKSDFSVEGRGFLISWEAVVGCASGEMRCWNKSCVPSSAKCNGVQDCPDNEDEFQCAVGEAGSANCGMPEVAPHFPFTPLIVGGHDAREGSWPWQIGLYRKHYGGSTFTCGGTLITNKFVLTAAHCVDSYSSYEVFVGDFNKSDTSPHERTIQVSTVMIHREYRSYKFENDIALLQLAESVDLSSKWHKSICLPEAGDLGPSANSTCVISGWGAIDGSSFSPDILQQSQLKILDDAKCDDIYDEYGTNGTHFICAGHDHDRENACYGDSGGPLSCFTNGKWVQYGVTSFGTTVCGERTFYANVSYYLDGINAALNYGGGSCDTLQVHHGASGSIAFPSGDASDFFVYDGSYNNINCSWLFVGPPNTLLIIRVGVPIYASLYNSYLTIYDGNTTSHRKVFDETIQITSYRTVRAFESSSNQVLISFTSADSYAALNISWEAVDDCSSTQFRCWDGSCINATLKCDNTSDCEDGSDEKSCVRPASEECGRQDIAPEFNWHARIVGGSIAKNGSWPGQAYIAESYSWSSYMSYRCEASIINDRWVLTAANCVYSKSSRYLYVIVGRNDKSYYPSDSEKYGVANIHVPSRYKSYRWDFDIALLELQETIQFSSTVQPVCIAQADTPEPYVGEQCVILGWGQTAGNYESTNLRQGVMPILNSSECEERYWSFVEESMICAGDPESGGIGACYSDYGPLMCFRDNVWIQDGIVSRQKSCGQSGTFDVFTKVSFHYDWIQETINQTTANEVIYNIIDQTKGNISSPDYEAGLYYPNNVNIRWNVVVTEGYLISVRFNPYFYIETSSGDELCSYDYLAVYDVQDGTPVMYGNKKFCGHMAPPDFETKGNSLVIEFKSDSTVGQTGFMITWEAVAGCQSDQLRCWDKTCVALSSKCDGNVDCADGEDEFQCAQGTAGSSECGKSEVAPEFPFTPLIVGGHDAQEGSWPWQIGLYEDSGYSTIFICGGTLISNRHVLTAAHCISRYQAYLVIVGDHDKSVVSSRQESFAVQNALVHRDYGSYTMSNDIAILVLNETVNVFSTWHKSICLPQPGDPGPPTISTCVITGWGAIDGNARTPDVLQQAHLRILNDSLCDAIAERTPAIRSQFICAGHDHDRENACFGDSGGPLACFVGDRWVQYGITSFGTGTCGERTFYSKISLYLDGINAAMNYGGGSSCEPLEIQEGSSGSVSFNTIASELTDFVAYENSYSTDCSWLFIGPSDTLLIIRIEVPEHRYLYSSSLTIYDGNSTSDRKVFDESIHLSTANIRAFESTSNKVLINLLSSDSELALNITWEAVEDCSSSQFRCWDGSCISADLKCDNTSHCIDGSDEKACSRPDHIECGRQDIAPEFNWHARIVGGSKAVNGSWPGQAYIAETYYWSSSGSSEYIYYRCEASIISDRWVLTAARCVRNLSERYLYVVVGNHERTTYRSDAQTYTVARIVLPPRYSNYYYMEFDIALIELQSSIEFSTVVQPVCFAQNDSPPLEAGEQCVILGWGSSGGSYGSTSLRQVRAPVLSSTTCKNATYNFNDDSMICTGDPESGGIGACYNDYGPLMCYHDNKWVQYGIVSSETSCGQSGRVDVFTKVSFYAGWIKQVVLNETHDSVTYNITNQTSGTISSPNYGTGIDYPNFANIRWHVTVPEGQLIAVTFDPQFYIEESFSGEVCSYDYLTVYDMENSSPMYGNKRFCGRLAPPDFETKGNSLAVEFTSDILVGGTGFMITWEAVDDCSTNELRCWDKTCVSSSSKCDGKVDCKDGEDEFQCAHGNPGSAQCGKPEVAPEFPFTPLIVGGHHSREGSWPWQIGLFVKSYYSTRFVCGGTLISDQHVLTAAHCISWYYDYVVSIGDYDHSNTSSHERMVAVDTIFIHRSYGSYGVEYDIAILQLNESIDLSSKWHKSICLPQSGDPGPPQNSTCVITGWGSIDGGYHSPDILQQTHVRIMNDATCDLVYDYRQVDGVHFICAGNDRDRQNACYGDSGGPLACFVEGSWVQYGITSFGNWTCGERTFYSNVSLYLDSIYDVFEYKDEVCTGLEVHEGSSGSVSYPKNISDFEIFGQDADFHNCSWLLKGPENTLLVIRVENIGSGSYYYGRYLTIYDGNSTSHRMVFDETIELGFKPIRAFESTSNQVLITFVSYYGGASLKMSWEAVESCTSSEFRCWDGTCVDSTMRCDGVSNCPDESDEKECARPGSMECGRQDIAPEFVWHTRIVGGSIAKSGSWPFQAFVAVDYGYYQSYRCEATILSDRWVLTAARCVYYSSASYLKVVVGNHSIASNMNNMTGYSVSRVHVHQNYSYWYGGSLEYDIALLELQTYIEFSSFVQPVCLPQSNTSRPEDGENCVVLGWGQSDGNYRSSDLRQALVPILNESVCEEMDNNYTDFKADRMICSGDPDSGGLGPCYNDHGPLLCFRNNVWIQYGIVSSKSSCGQTRTNDIFTRVSFFIDWILNVTGSLPVPPTSSPPSESSTTTIDYSDTATAPTETATSHTNWPITGTTVTTVPTTGMSTLSYNETSTAIHTGSPSTVPTTGMSTPSYNETIIADPSSWPSTVGTAMDTAPTQPATTDYTNWPSTLSTTNAPESTRTIEVSQTSTVSPSIAIDPTTATDTNDATKPTEPNNFTVPDETEPTGANDETTNGATRLSLCISMLLVPICTVMLLKY